MENSIAIRPMLVACGRLFTAPLLPVRSVPVVVAPGLPVPVTVAITVAVEVDATEEVGAGPPVVNART